MDHLVLTISLQQLNIPVFPVHDTLSLKTAILRFPDCFAMNDLFLQGGAILRHEGNTVRDEKGSKAGLSRGSRPTIFRQRKRKAIALTYFSPKFYTKNVHQID